MSDKKLLPPIIFKLKGVQMVTFQAYQALEKQVEELKERRDNYFKADMAQQYKIKALEKQVKELKEKGRALLDGVAGLPPLTAIQGVLTKQYKELNNLIND